MATCGRHRTGSVTLGLMVASILFACGRGEETPPAQGGEGGLSPMLPFSRTLGGIGLSEPDAVLHDPDADVYLVANTEGAGGDQDPVGFISRISPEGRVLDLRWIDGGDPGIELQTPRGMAVVADTLYVADGSCVRRFHRINGTPLNDLCLEEASRLSDVAETPRGDLYFADAGSDSASGALYLLRQSADVPQKVTLRDGTVLEGDSLGGPKGLYADRRGLYVATYGSGELFRVTPEGERLQMLFPSDAGLSGIVSLEERGFLYSCEADSAVHWIHGDGTVSSLIEGRGGPGDMGFDQSRNRVLVPLPASNEIILLEVR